LHGDAKLKVPGGKLVAVKVTYSRKIEGIQILGDFFIHPEESLAQIEECLVGMDSGASSDEIAKRIDSLARERGIQMIGITPEAIAQVMRMAIK